MKNPPNESLPGARVRLVLCALMFLALCLGSVQAKAAAFQNFDLWQSSKFRGFNLGSTNPQDMAVYQSIDANVGRVFVSLTRPKGGNQFVLPDDIYNRIDRLVETGKTYGFKLVVTFNPLPKAPDLTYFFDTQQQASLVAILRDFARHYAGENTFAGFDLLNEPYPVTQGHSNVPPGFDGLKAWESLASRMITAIRQEDPTRVVIYEFPYFASQYGTMRPLPFDGVVYSTHFYTPHALTHQGISGRPMGVSYPSAANSSIGLWNKTVIQQALAPVRAFQLAYRKPVYIGEFSCNRQAPGQSSFHYSSDALSVFEAYGWNWTYMGFRGSNYWDAELAHGERGAKRSLNTDLMTYLRQTLAKAP